MRFLKNKSKPHSLAGLPEGIPITQATMDLAFPNKSAGRWCEYCKDHGTHHSASHNEFAAKALELTGKKK